MNIHKIILITFVGLVSLCIDPLTIVGSTFKPDEQEIFSDFQQLNTLITLQDNSFHGTDYQIKKKIKVVVTAYSSTPDQCDDTPFVTAAGNQVREGIVAANFLPFGTKITMPEIFKGKMFVVDDRMHPRKQYMVDVWFPTREQAIAFGSRTTYIEVVE